MADRRFSDVGGTSGGLGDFLLGFALTCVGGYLLTNQVIVAGSYWNFWGGNTFGITLIPMLIGIGLLFRDGRSVNDRLEINVPLEVGATSDTITVAEEVPLLDTTNASIGRVIDFRELRELPAEHGDPDNLIKLSLGVGFTDNPSKDQPWQTLNASYAMAGERGALNEFTLDGTSNTLHDSARGSVAEAWTPPGDAVAEYKVQTASFDATTGATQGGVVNVSLKSGTNQLHGTVYWGKETTSMNANLFFSNLNNIPIEGLKYNRLGGTVGGPVYIPKLYNGKNRTFFFFTYENIHSITALTGADAAVDKIGRAHV